MKKCKRHVILFLLAILTMLILCSCSNPEDELIDIHAWKDKLKGPNTHYVDNPLPEIKEGADKAADYVAEKGADGKDAASSLGNNIVDTIKGWADTPSDLPLLDNSEEPKDEERNMPESTEDINELIEQISGTDKRIHVKYKRTVDGDTIVVARNGTELPRIRLIGINTPESVHPDESKNVTEGKYASDYLKEYMTGIEDLWLEIGIETHDDYGRILAYVWLSETSSADDMMLNIHMVKAGWAEPMTIEPNSKYKDKIETAAADK